MALRRMEKKKAVAIRTTRPRAVAIAARLAYLARTQRNVPYDPPESPAIQAAPLVNLSVPTSSLTLNKFSLLKSVVSIKVVQSTAFLHFTFKVIIYFAI
jgi:hypothetical protein